MVSPVAPALPVVLANDEGETTTASTPREYWQAIYDGFFILGTVPPTPRDQIKATLADLDGLARQTGGVVSVTGPTLPGDLTAGTKYVWNQTDAATGDLLDIITGVI